MPSRWALAALLLAVCSAFSSAQDMPPESKLDSKIESIGLFKNGLAVVRRSVELPSTGPFRIENIPAPVHGTFWISSPVAVAAQVSARETDAPPRAGDGVSFQQQLVGKVVTIHFRDSGIPPLNGKVIQLTGADGDRDWSRTYQQPDLYNYINPGRAAPSAGQFLILESGSSHVYADTSLIGTLSVDGASVKRMEPVLLLTVEDDAQQKKNQPVHVTITYLTKGVAWAPAYRINLDDVKNLTLVQQAAIRNEMESFKDAQLELISGFPSIQFANVTSPLDTTWANFFAQLSQRQSPDRGLMANAVQSQSISNRAASDPSVDLSAIPSGDGVDLHYQPIGKRSMREGDSLLLTTGQGKATYERIVEWNIPDNRDAMGRWNRTDNYGEPQEAEEGAWDAIRFKNPLNFPMTTAPALVTSGEHFNGQRQSFWVNTGEQTTLQITKALSIRTLHTEHEDAAAGRELLRIGGRDYRKTAVQARLQVSNHRAEPITLTIIRRFSGDLVKADENPRVSLAEEGIYSINKRNVATWSLGLAAGESKTLNYEYTVLVAN